MAQISPVSLSRLTISFGLALALILGPTLSHQATVLAADPAPINSGVNLLVESFNLTDVNGVVKTTFKTGERIYLQSTIRNNGTKSSVSGSKTQYFINKPSSVNVGTKDSPEISTSHGVFTVAAFTYQSRPGGSRASQFTTASFAQTTPGTYTARIFTDANNTIGETKESDNQRTVTYTVTGTNPTPTPTPKPTSTPTPTPTPTSVVPAAVNSGVNIVINSFQLTDANGTVKTTFAPNEKIYVRSVLSNTGSSYSSSGSRTQYFANRPTTVAVGSKDTPEMATAHGVFASVNGSSTYTYESRPNGSRSTQFTTASFSQSTPGTYTARAFTDANNNIGETSETDNQRTITYTITGTTPTPTPTPTPVEPAATPTPTPTTLPTPTPTPTASNVNLTVNSFSLTNASGTVKTTFAAGEQIFVKAAITNNGTVSSASGSQTQFYAHQPTTAVIGSKNNPEVSVTHGSFTVATFNYESRPNGSRSTQFNRNYFTQVAPGTFTARIFTDANNSLGETNETDNQRTVTYTITATPLPTATPWPSSTVWPQPVADPTSVLAIVNKKFILDRNYVPSDLVYPTIANPKSHKLRQVTVTALQNMAAAAKSQSNITFRVASGYRSYQTQYDLYWGYVANNGQASADTFSARPGHSEHQSGLSLDIGDAAAPQCDVENCFKDTAGGKWIAANGHKYGFVVRYPSGKDAITGYKYEPWHIRYFGVAVATAIYNSGKTVEEYFSVPGGGYQ